jgi:hypothetical protein
MRDGRRHFLWAALKNIGAIGQVAAVGARQQRESVHQTWNWWCAGAVLDW